MYRQNRYRRRRRVGGVPMVLLAVLLVVMAGVLYGCAQAQGRQVPGQPAGAPEGEPGQAAEPEGPDDAGEEPVISNGTDDGAAGDQAGESGDAQAAPEEPYDYSQPVPERAAVEDSYCDDAVFLGNSITEGFMLYAGPSGAAYMTDIGLMVDTVFTDQCVTVGDEKLTVMDALKQTDFSKVYIMLGTNELGWVYGSVYQEYYGRIIDGIREANPDAVIYIQSILPVTAEKSESDKIYNNERITEFNGLLRSLAEEKQAYYVNVAEGVADENGCLPEDGSFDGVHPTPDCCKQWMDYLRTHTVEA